VRADESRPAGYERFSHISILSVSVTSV
jgi:hypothetical protein